MAESGMWEVGRKTIGGMWEWPEVDSKNQWEVVSPLRETNNVNKHCLLIYMD